jgi:hypothetical protein
MFGRNEEVIGCPSYRARLEESLTARAANADGELNAHVRECARCREALDTALLASQLLRDAQQSVLDPPEAFVTRVMASIREQESRLAGPGAIWRPLELLASRVALVAAAVLLGLSLHLTAFAPARSTTATARHTEVGAGLPERPALPANEDEVLMSLAETSDGL